MRDPGTPRRNPFFEYGSEADASDLGMGWRDHAEDVGGESNQARDTAGGGGERATDPGSTFSGPDDAAGGFAMLLALVEGLSDAQPEAAEHLVAAAHEVVLTVKVLVDATEAVLAQQRAAMADRRAADADDADDAEAGAAQAEAADIDLTDASDLAPVTVLPRSEDG